MLFASLVADFVLQPTSLVTWKQRQFRGLLIHIVIVLGLSLLVGLGIWSLRYLALVAVIVGLHLAVDWAKILVDRRKPNGYWPLGTFVADQALHVLAILALLSPFGFSPPLSVRELLGTLFSESTYLGLGSIYITSVLAGSIVVRFVVQPMRVDVPGRPGLLGAGAYIGMVERLLITTLVAAGQFAAVGFVLAAKSIARYKQMEAVPGFAEYYLVGTLTSSTIAVLAGLLVRAILY